MARILIVDDSIYILALLRRVLEAAGHEVVGQARDGAEALEAFARLQPDLAIVDIVLPGLGGIEIIRRLRAIVPAARVVVYSAYGHEEKVREALAAGAREYVVKTPDPQPLVAAVEKAAGRRAGDDTSR
jgi:two-component system chemotaxis response regulator CheY